MHPVVHLFGRAVQSYYLCALAAALAGLILAAVSLRREKLGAWRWFLPLLTAAVALAGARVLNYFTNPEAYGSFSLWTLSYSKLSLMGGLVPGVGVLLLFAALKKRSPAPLLDAFSLPAAAGIVLLKLGCFLNGCCFGVPTEGPFGMVFPANAGKYAFLQKLHLPVTGQRVHPTQLYEMFGAVCAIGIAIALEKKLKLRPGGRFCIFSALFALTRLIVLPLRTLPYADGVIHIFYPCLYGGIIAVCAVWLFVLCRKRV